MSSTEVEPRIEIVSSSNTAIKSMNYSSLCFTICFLIILNVAPNLSIELSYNDCGKTTFLFLFLFLFTDTIINVYLIAIYLIRRRRGESYKIVIVSR